MLAHVEDMREHAFVRPSSGGGGHTLWVLGHLAYIEGLVVRTFALGEPNPLAKWQEVFDGAEVPDDPERFPSFDETLAMCRGARDETRKRIDALTEPDLDRASANAPEGYEDSFGTVRLCLQYVADHWYMHRGQLAGARRAAGVDRMWV